MRTSTLLRPALCSAFLFNTLGGLAMSREEFPAEAFYPDEIMPTAALVEEVPAWAEAVLGGTPRAAGAQRIELELRRQDHGTFGLNRSCIGTAPLRIGGRSYEHGLGTHANSEIAVRIPPGAAAFTAQVGIDDNHDTQGKRGSVVFTAELDGREVFRTPMVHGGEEPAAVHIDLPAGARELVLKVDTTADGPGHDQSDWADARFELAGGGVLWLDQNQADRLLLSDAVPFSFRYGEAASDELLKAWRRTAETGEQADRREYTVTWTAPDGLRVTAAANVFKRYAAIEWVLYFENTGGADTPILADIQALDVRLATSPAQQPAILHQVRGDTCNADTFLPMDTVLAAGQSLRIAPDGGRSSANAFPFVNFEFAGRGLIAAVGWTGQWCTQLERADGGATRWRAGLEKTHLRLHPGERIRSPRILLLPWSGDRVASHNRFRRLMLHHYVPQQDGRPVRPPVALQCFDRYVRTVPEWATEAGQLRAAQAAEALGCDTVWLDAAWFPGDFPHGVGNWRCKPAEFPRGLAPVSAACHDHGLKFMLWFEPERVGAETEIAREHPEFVFGGTGGGLFKLNDPAARKWLTDLLSERIREYGVDVYRNDFNIDPLEFWRKNDAPDRQGMTEIRYIEGLYAMWDELRARHPGLVIDNCASGGRRIDLEMCMRSLPLWRSDTGCTTNPVHWNQVQCCGLSLYVPLHAVASWTHAAYDVRSVASAGVVCQWDYLGAAFPVEAARAAVTEARENQPYWVGDLYLLTPVTAADDQWAAYQFHRPDLGAGMVLAFRRGGSEYTGLTVAPRALGDGSTRYQVEFLDENRHKTSETLSGAQLAEGIELNLPRKATSVLVRYRAMGTE